MLVHNNHPNSVQNNAANSSHVESQISILVVDDDPSVRMMVRTYLQLEGFAVTEAANGDEALARADADPPQAVVLDIMMPGLDGFAVCRRLRENPKTSRTVIMLLSV